MELYTPSRILPIAQLRWLLQQAEIPLDLRCKELLKMLLKLWLWLLCEPRRRENFTAIPGCLHAPLPSAGSF